MAFESSLSKGCFIQNPKKSVDPFLNFKEEIWDKAFSSVWNEIDVNLKDFSNEISSQLTASLVDFVKSAESAQCKIPTAVLLTGVNLPDHSLLFSQLVSTLKSNLDCGIASLHPSYCSNLKNTVEIMVSHFMNNNSNIKEDLMDEGDSDDDEGTKALAKSACNMPNLVKWFNNRSPNKKRQSSSYKLVIIIPDFEGMSPKVLHDFLLIISCYVTKLPLVLILGVATSASVVGDILEHSITSKLSARIFQTQKSIHILNNVLDKIFLNKDCPLQLGPKILEFLMNTFLFYDFSVQKFTLGIKFCIMDHFFQQPHKILCTNIKDMEKVVKKLTDDDLEVIRNLESFKKYFETLSDSKKSLLSDKTSFKKCIVKLMQGCHKKLDHFYLSLKLLQTVIADLPEQPLGKQMRELYVAAMRGNVSKSSEYKECCHLMKFQGKNNLMEKVDQLIELCGNVERFADAKERLKQFEKELDDLDSNKDDNTSSPSKITITKSRNEFKEAMIALTKKKRDLSFEGIRDRLIDYLMKDLFPVCLEPVTSLPLSEIIVCDAVRGSNIKRYLVGYPRGDIHHALVHPKDVLMCNCCAISEPGEIPSTFPDICIAYKLHLECGALINLHDWLQSFATVVDPESALDDTEEIDPLIQARFMQAVSDLEFMGFVKPSKRKADHVARMTWGGSG